MTATWTKALACVVAAACLLPAPVFGEDWPQLGNNPQRWNYTPEKIEPPYRLAWYVNFQDFGFDYRIYPGIQVVVAGGKAYVGTKNHYFYALDAASGKVAWCFPLAGPVMGAAAYTGGLAIVGCMDGSVYAVNAETGRQAWRFRSGRRYGFSADVLVADGKVFMPDRGGMLYALDAKTGSKLWQYDAGAQVLHTPPGTTDTCTSEARTGVCTLSRLPTANASGEPNRCERTRSSERGPSCSAGRCCFGITPRTRPPAR